MEHRLLQAAVVLRQRVYAHGHVLFAQPAAGYARADALPRLPRPLAGALRAVKALEGVYVAAAVRQDVPRPAGGFQRLRRAREQRGGLFAIDIELD